MRYGKNWDQVELNIFPGPNDTWAVTREDFKIESRTFTKEVGKTFRQRHTGKFKDMLDIYKTHKEQLEKKGFNEIKNPGEVKFSSHEILAVGIGNLDSIGKTIVGVKK